jgi:hypothetical protein
MSKVDRIAKIKVIIFFVIIELYLRNKRFLSDLNEVI